MDKLTKAQARALKTIDDNVVLHGAMKAGHAYDWRGITKLIDRRTLVAVDEKDLIRWEMDWGYEDHAMKLTEKGAEILKKIDQDNG